MPAKARAGPAGSKRTKCPKLHGCSSTEDFRARAATATGTGPSRKHCMVRRQVVRSRGPLEGQTSPSLRLALRSERQSKSSSAIM